MFQVVFVVPGNNPVWVSNKAPFHELVLGSLRCGSVQVQRACCGNRLCVRHLLVCFFSNIALLSWLETLTSRACTVLSTIVDLEGILLLSLRQSPHTAEGPRLCKVDGVDGTDIPPDQTGQLSC